MSQKQTYGKSVVYRPDTEAWPTTNGFVSKTVATSGREIAALGLKSGGPAAVRFHNCLTPAAATPANERWFLETSATVNDSQIFPNPIFFNVGLTIVIEQGAGLNPVICLEYIPSDV